jgi:hypothetical protein
MGFYIRKSLNFGPLRLNLSGSGIGVSTGIKGFRIGTGPRGNYIHAGMGGLYYRQTLGGRIRRRPQHHALPSPQPTPNPDYASQGPMQEIESGEISRLADHSAAGLLQELNSKRAMFRFYPLSLVAVFITSVLYISQPHWGWVLLGIVLVGLTGFCIWWDRQRKTTVLFYNLQPPVLPGFESLHNAFENLGRCSARWHVDAQAAVSDRKYHAGATSNVRRSRIGLHMKSPPHVKTNIPVLCLPAGRQQLYFFPDRILVYDSNGVGAVSYAGLRVCPDTTRFIESEGVPSDSQVVGRTWRYVNRDGGPDRRFRDNREIPIVLYSEVHFRSDTGLNELFMFSAASSFLAALNAFRDCLATAKMTPPPTPLDVESAFQEANFSDVDTPASAPPAAPEPAPETTVVEPPVGAKKFYYFGNGVEGPFTTKALELLAEQGVISTQTQVCSMDDQQWLTYQEFLEKQRS